MDMQAAIRARLAADAGISALVSSRIYWTQAPQSAALPRITLNTVSTDHSQNFKAYQSLKSTRLQCDIRAATYAETRTIFAAVFSELSSQETSNGVTFNRIFVDSERDGFERTDTQEIYTLSVDLIVWWSV